MLPHIAIIGAGNLGSRHLQGLNQINRKISISVIDPNKYSLETAKKRFDKKKINKFIKSISYATKMNKLKGNIDLVIIATNADVRKVVIEKLLNRVSVRYMVLEKVAFQSVRDFRTVIALLEANDTKAWVNCTRRMYPFYRLLKAKLKTDNNISMQVEGGDWGLASNSIHMLDLFAFLTGETQLVIDASGLDLKIYRSKRKDFIELGGKLEASSNRGDQLILIDDKKSRKPALQQIASDNHRYFINQSKGTVSFSHKKNGWKKKEEVFVVPHQSELTHLVVQQIMDNGQSYLTSLKESFLLHKPMFDAYNTHLTSVVGKDYEVCPIT